jgi:NADH:ubiquinone oxidoreductase subunit 4 (subunit M)
MSSLLLLFIVSLSFVVLESNTLRFVLVILCLYVISLCYWFLSSSSSSLLSFLLLSITLISLCFFHTQSILVFYIMFEFRLLPVTSLILLFGYQPEKLSSAVYLLVYTVVGSLPLLFFVSISPFDLSSSFSSLSLHSSLFVLLSFMIKSPLFYLHAWLPKAHTEAPLIGSMLLSGIILKFGGYGILVCASSFPSIPLAYFFVTLLGSVVCCVICLRCWDLKSLVAYSSIVHMGLVTLGCFSCTFCGYDIAVGIMVRHTLVSPLLFSLAFDYYSTSHSRCFIFGFCSSVSRHFLLLFYFWSGVNFGIPPSLSFWVEVSLFCLFSSLFQVGLIFLFLSSYFCFAYCMVFCCSRIGGFASSSLSGVYSAWVHLPALTYVLLVPFISSFY